MAGLIDPERRLAAVTHVEQIRFERCTLWSNASDRKADSRSVGGAHE
jgi:hypothetical protein